MGSLVLGLYAVLLAGAWESEQQAGAGIPHPDRWTKPGALYRHAPGFYVWAVVVAGQSGSLRGVPVNGQSIGQHTWDGLYSEELVSFAFTSSDLLEGPNTVEAHVCWTETYYDITMYDWIELDVRRKYQAEDDSLFFEVAEAGWQYRLGGFLTNTIEIFDVSGTYTVSHLVDADVTLSDSQYAAAFYDEAADQGTRYLALTHDRLKSPLSIVKDIPSNLETAKQADYIVIAPKVFITDVQPLVGHRAAQGLTVQVVELDQIFDEFNYGIYSPEAIRDFLAYAFTTGRRARVRAAGRRWHL